MRQFVQFETADGLKILINKRYIVAIEPDGEGSKILVDGLGEQSPRTYLLRESYEDVVLKYL